MDEETREEIKLWCSIVTVIAATVGVVAKAGNELMTLVDKGCRVFSRFKSNKKIINNTNSDGKVCV